MLFGDRVFGSDLVPEGDFEAFVDGGFLVDSVIALAKRLGVNILS
jgi:hypothetical protein